MKLSDVKKLHQKKYRTQFGYYLVEGEHLVLELLKVVNVSESPINAKDITYYVTEQYKDWLSENCGSYGEQSAVEILSSQQMTQLSDTKSPQGIIACVPLPTHLSSDRLPDNTKQELRSTPNRQYVYLYETQDPGNLGTILRSLAWFGNFTLLMSPNSVDPFNSKVVRSSMGAIFHVDMELNVPLTSLATRFEKFACLDMHGEGIASPSFGDFQCYLFGNEARGVPKEALEQLNAVAFTIPGSGQIDSLNLASAVNICAYELAR